MRRFRHFVGIVERVAVAVLRSEFVKQLARSTFRAFLTGAAMAVGSKLFGPVGAVGAAWLARAAGLRDAPVDSTSMTA